MNGMNTADTALATLRGDVIDIVLGTVFLTVVAESMPASISARLMMVDPDHSGLLSTSEPFS